jgi:alpha-glucosidase (family GH31 glycosyl hydrolase)
MFGVRDDEMYLRWLQFGVFSPINRLHSTSDDLAGKEPWNYRKDIENFATEQLKLRHSLIPYIHTMNYRNHKQGIAICEPMYYSCPQKEEAYKVKNQYMFGSELMVCPIVKKADKRTNFASVKAYIPEGRWTDIFTGYIYTGGKMTELFRDESSIPVLAKEGAIIPLSRQFGNDSGNPEKLELWVYRGNGSFEMYEDNENRLKASFTTFKIEGDEELIFTINPSVGATDFLPETREYNILFKDVENGSIKAKSGDFKTKAQGNRIVITVKNGETATVKVEDFTPLSNADYMTVAVDKICRLQGDNLLKGFRYNRLKKSANKQQFVERLRNSAFPKKVKNAILELVEE